MPIFGLATSNDLKKIESSIMKKVQGYDEMDEKELKTYIDENLKASNTKMDEKLSSMEEQYSSLSSKIEEDLKASSTKMDEKLSSMEEQYSSMTSTIDEDLKASNTIINEKLSAMEEKYSKADEKIKASIQKTDEKVSSMEEQYSSKSSLIDDKMKIFNTKISEFEAMDSRINEKLTTNKQDDELRSEKLNKKYEDISKTLDSVNKKDEDVTKKLNMMDASTKEINDKLDSFKMADEKMEVSIQKVVDVLDSRWKIVEDFNTEITNKIDSRLNTRELPTCTMIYKDVYVCSEPASDASVHLVSNISMLQLIEQNDNERVCLRTADTKAYRAQTSYPPHYVCLEKGGARNMLRTVMPDGELERELQRDGDVMVSKFADKMADDISQGIRSKINYKLQKLKDTKNNQNNHSNSRQNSPNKLKDIKNNPNILIKNTKTCEKLDENKFCQGRLEHRNHLKTKTQCENACINSQTCTHFTTYDQHVHQSSLVRCFHYSNLNICTATGTPRGHKVSTYHCKNWT